MLQKIKNWFNRFSNKSKVYSSLWAFRCWDELTEDEKRLLKEEAELRRLI